MEGFEVFSPAYLLEVTTVINQPFRNNFGVCVSVGVQGGGAVSTLVSVDPPVLVPSALLVLVHRRGEPLPSKQLSWTWPPCHGLPSSCKLPSWTSPNTCLPGSGISLLSPVISSSLPLPGSPHLDQPGLGYPRAHPEEHRRGGSAQAQGCSKPTWCLPTFIGSV